MSAIELLWILLPAGVELKEAVNISDLQPR